MLSAQLPPDTLVRAKVNMYWDGLFHAAVWVLTAVGLGLLWAATGRPDCARAGRCGAGCCWAGGCSTWSKASSTTKYWGCTTSASIRRISCSGTWRFSVLGSCCCWAAGPWRGQAAPIPACLPTFLPVLDLVVDARPASIAHGFDVRRILPYRLRRMLGPFIFMDHAGPVHATPEQLPSLDVLPQPHIGLSTATPSLCPCHQISLGRPARRHLRPSLKAQVFWLGACSACERALQRFPNQCALRKGVETRPPSYTDCETALGWAVRAGSR